METSDLETREVTLADLAYMLGSLQKETQALAKRVDSIQGIRQVGPMVNAPIVEAGPSSVTFPVAAGAAGGEPGTGVPIIHVSSPTTLPLAPPERYFGDSQKFASFVTQCQ